MQALKVKAEAQGRKAKVCHSHSCHKTNSEDDANDTSLPPSSPIHTKNSSSKLALMPMLVEFDHRRACANQAPPCVVNSRTKTSNRLETTRSAV